MPWQKFYQQPVKQVPPTHKLAFATVVAITGTSKGERPLLNLWPHGRREKEQECAVIFCRLVAPSVPR